MSNRLFLCCLGLLCSFCVGGCGDREGSRDNAAVERRLKEAIEDQGKHQVKSVALKKHSDGSYSGSITTRDGDNIPVKNVIVEEKKISWEETIDQTGKGR